MLFKKKKKKEEIIEEKTDLSQGNFDLFKNNDDTKEELEEFNTINLQSEESVFENNKEENFFKRLVKGLTKTRNNISEGFSSLFSGFSELDDDFYEELEEILIMADIGVNTTESIIDELKKRTRENKIKTAEECRELLKNIITDKLLVTENDYVYEREKSVVLMVGVNGAGKTTTVGKLAASLKGKGLKVMMAAADTFRAAAIDQLSVWSKRAGVDIVAGQEGSDPASVIYDSISSAKAKKVDVLLCDTAGRLQNKSNLMKELGKINKIIDREYPEAHKETLIVLDATTGQNALSQAKEFKSVTDITGIVLTKLDGTAKGGIVIAIQSELNIPVKYIGVGEGIEDLQKFDPKAFAEALF